MATGFTTEDAEERPSRINVAVSQGKSGRMILVSSASSVGVAHSAD